MHHQHQHQQHRTGTARQRQGQGGQRQTSPDAGMHRHAHPCPDVDGPIAQCRRQRGGCDAHGSDGQHKHGPPHQRADHRVRQQTRHQQAQRHAQQFACRRQRTLQRRLAHRQPGQKRGAVQQVDQRALQPLQPLAQAKRLGGRKQQCPGPQRQQHQRATRIGHKPAGAQGAPAVNGTQKFKQRGQQRAGQRPACVQHQVQVGGHTLGQVNLQKLHRQRQQRAGQGSQRHSAAQPTGTQQCQRQQKTQRRIAQHVDGNVKAGPVRRRDARQQKHLGCYALGAPAFKREKAGKDNQRRIHQRQWPGSGLVHGAKAGSENNNSSSGRAPGGPLRTA